MFMKLSRSEEHNWNENGVEVRVEETSQGASLKVHQWSEAQEQNLDAALTFREIKNKAKMLTSDVVTHVILPVKRRVVVPVSAVSAARAAVVQDAVDSVGIFDFFKF